MANFLKNSFAMLDVDSDDEKPMKSTVKKTVKKGGNKSAASNVEKVSPIMEPSRKNGGGRGTDGGRGGGRGRNGGRGGRQRYDRKDRQGRGNDGQHAKKSGGGRHNWGSNKDETKPDGDVTDAVTPEGEGSATPEDVEEEEPKEPEKEVFTLEEFEARRKAAMKQADEDLFGEIEERDVDESEFENLKSNVEELDNYWGGESSKKLRQKGNKQRAINKVKVTDVGFSAPSYDRRDDYNDRRGGRGGRGEGRGRGRGGRGGRGGRSHNPNVEDVNAFPEL